MLISDSHKYLKVVLGHEKYKIIRVANSLCDAINVDDLVNKDAKTLSSDVKKSLKENHKSVYTDPTLKVTYVPSRNRRFALVL